MRYPASFVSCCIVIVLLFGYRSHYSDIGGARKQLVVTKWDAFGYYLYLPALFIYEDYKKLSWAGVIDKQYHVTGGDGLPVQHLDNGHKVCKYLGGVAILQAPFFFTACAIARVTGYPADGFSPPFQYALALGAIIWCGLALFLLRRILLRYYNDRVTAITIGALCLATNFIQYVAVDSGLSHAWIFPLYALLLYATMRWHSGPRKGWSFLIGYIIGLATICRPTEAVALFIPLLWDTHTKAAARQKWALVKMNRPHALIAILGGVVGIMPQLLYWKAVTGSFIYDVGSKWFFLNPWFRVLTGWEKGWFVYTPITILFILGMLFMRKYPFRKSVLAFCGLTIWIVIAWEDWQYGASYSTRALMQSYPVFALPLAAVIDRLNMQKWRWAFYILCIYLTGVNLFQVIQYNSTILHYGEMNRRYYSHIYLNTDPSPIDMSLLDTHEAIEDESKYQTGLFKQISEPVPVNFTANSQAILIDTTLPAKSPQTEYWLKLEARINAPDKLWKSKFALELKAGDSTFQTSVRLFNPVGERTGNYAFYARIPPYFYGSELRVLLSSQFDFHGIVEKIIATELYRPL